MIAQTAQALDQAPTGRLSVKQLVVNYGGKKAMGPVDMEIPGKQMVLDAMAEGLLMNCTHDTVLRFLPPYIITEKEVDWAMKVLAKIFAKAK